MAADIKAILKMTGLPENELRGKSAKELIKLIAKKLSAEQDELDNEQAKVYMSNYDKLFPKVKSALEQSVEIYVKSVGQKKSPTIVSVVGYNSANNETVVFLNNKLYSIKEDDIIKSMEELMNIKENKKPKTTSKSTKKK